ncbi:MAG: cysteine peptidase family C39 domain-containing protein [Planctomycetota bacterium]
MPLCLGAVLRPTLETIGCVALIGAAYGGWRVVARTGSRGWAASYLVPLVVLAMLAAARWLAWLEFYPPFSWLMAGRVEFVLGGVAVAGFLAALPPRLRRGSQRFVVAAFLVLVIIRFAVLPFLLPAVLSGQFARLGRRVDPDGVCLQSTRYTCGPAAAVTALERLGVTATEGGLAAQAHTNHISGTQPDALAAAIGELHADEGVGARYRYFGSPDELRGQEPVIALIKWGLMVDHYVTVLEVTGQEVVLGDPLGGHRRMGHGAFGEIWRHTGVAVWRAP